MGLLLAIRRDLQGAFRRSVRDEAGAILKTLVFAPGDVVHVEDEDLVHVANDVGKALVMLKADKNDVPRVVADELAQKLLAKALKKLGRRPGNSNRRRAEAEASSEETEQTDDETDTSLDV